MTDKRNWQTPNLFSQLKNLKIKAKEMYFYDDEFE